MKTAIGVGLSVLSLVTLVSCKKESAVSDTPAPPVSTTEASSAGLSADLAAQGKAVYMSQCLACHNSDPKLAGSLGPDVFGSSRELLEARIMTATYPAGYAPKRTTKMMVAMPALKDKIDALHAYLNLK